MIIGAHTVIYSRDPVVDRAFLRDVCKLSSVDIGEGWLIFGLPPAEIAVHPSNRNNIHEFYLMCDDLQQLVADLRELKVKCTPVQHQRWGLLTHVSLPGGGQLGIYQPRHARPKSMDLRKKSNRKKAVTSKKAGATRKRK